MNALSREQQLTVLHLLVEGNSLRSITRLTHIHRTTILKLLVKVGAKCRTFLDRTMHNLHLNHLQCDEIWTFVLKKQGRLSDQEAGNTRIGDQFLFIALDEETKLIPSFVLGKRTKENADMLMQDLAGTDRGSPAILPEPSAASQHGRVSGLPECCGRGFRRAQVDYGVIIKTFREHEQPGRYGPPKMETAVRQVIQGRFDKREICTSHVRAP